MHSRLAALVLMMGSPALAAEPLPLQALNPTSGAGAEKLLDGEAATGWRPEGSSVDEGVLLRLEKAVALDGVAVRACAGTEPFELGVFADTAPVGEAQARAEKDAEVKFEKSRQTRSLFLRVQQAGRGPVCLGEVRLLQGGKPLALAPPRVVQGQVRASSVLEPANAYHPSYLFDGRTDFGWVEGARGTGAGESLTLTLQAPVELVALELWNGYQRSEDHFRKNARAAQLALSVDGGAPVVLAVKDAQGAQRLALPAPMKGSTFQLTVKKAVAGKKYPDLVLSELRLVDTRGPLHVRTSEEQQRAQALRASVKDSGLASVVDRRFVNRCMPMKGYSTRSFKLRGNHTFVFYDESGAEDTSATEVMDGAWVVQKTGTPWATVELFGRRHRSAASWEPYRADSSLKKKDTTRIAGGKLEVARVADLDKATFDKLVGAWVRTRSPKEEMDCAGRGVKDGGIDHARLSKEGAIIVRGPALTDLLVPDEVDVGP